MWLNGAPIAAGTTYSVTVNSFLASGGDNFRAFAQGTSKRDTGKVDLQAMVDYMAEFANTSEGDARSRSTTPSTRSAWPSRPAQRRTTVGDTVEIDLSSLAFSTAADLKDTRSRRSSRAVAGHVPGGQHHRHGRVRRVRRRQP